MPIFTQHKYLFSLVDSCFDFFFLIETCLNFPIPDFVCSFPYFVPLTKKSTKIQNSKKQPVGNLISYQTKKQNTTDGSQFHRRRMESVFGDLRGRQQGARSSLQNLPGILQDDRQVAGQGMSRHETVGDGALFHEAVQSLKQVYILYTRKRFPLRRNLISLFVVDGIRYEPWVGQFSDQSNYKLMLGTRKPVEDLRTATKMELTSGGSGGSSLSVTKPSPSAASMQAHSWKSSGFSQCSASCLGGNGLWLSLSLHQLSSSLDIHFPIGRLSLSL